MSAVGGKNDKPRVFNTARPVSGECGDSDLGAPNSHCPGRWRSRRGKGGKPDEPGVNCSPLDNALIIQEPGEKCPDDNVDGGLMMFDFEPMADSVKSIGLLDIDSLTLVKVEFMNESGKIDYIIISVPLLGDNSYQLVSLDVEKVTGPVAKRE